MSQTNRRLFLGGLAFGASAVTTHALAASGDGHAAGYDVASDSQFTPLIPRRAGQPPAFTYPLDRQTPKATSGGWARDVTMRNLPISEEIAGAHLFVNPGGAREMHWHRGAEWACVLAGHCQVTVVDPAGMAEVVNYAPGDLWYFPGGHSHAIQTLGEQPFHAILTFDDGLYSEHGTFGMSDWMSRLDASLLAQNFGIPADFFGALPKAETYIMQSRVIPLDGAEARCARELDHARTHRHALMARTPWREFPGGTIHRASTQEFPLSATVTGLVIRLHPGAMHELHWHSNANEWFYVTKGRIRATMFGVDKRMATAELQAGDCAYIPRGCGHSEQNIGTDECEIVGSLDNGVYEESTLSAWVANAPRHLLANNFGITEAAVPDFPKWGQSIIARV